jgi:nitrate reductase (NAD(P)H)
MNEADHINKDPEPEESHVFLNKRKWGAVTLTSVIPASHDSFIFKFALPSPDLELGLPVGQHVFVRLRRKTSTKGSTEGELAQRAYTPVSPQNAKGHIELLVK